MAAFKPFFLSLLPLALVGCAWVRDDVALSNQRGWERLTSLDYMGTFTRGTGLNLLFPGPETRENLADSQLCLHSNGEERVLTQNGVSDRVDYRRCAVSPYGSDFGSRLGNRPEPQPF